MADVARLAGVHQTTVSLALRDHPSIPEHTREKIRNIARKLRYRRNPLVSALMSERRKGRSSGKGTHLGFLTLCDQRGQWRRESPTYARLFDLMVAHARAMGYELEEFWLNEPGISRERLARILLNRGIRGLILSPLPEGTHNLDFDFSQFAAVALRYTLKTPTLDHVSTDYCSSMNLAIDRLLESGHRRIAFATTAEIDERVSHLSLGAWLSRRHFQPRSFLVPHVAVRWEKLSLLRWLHSRRPPDALIVPIHSLHEKSAVWLAEEGWNLPVDLSLVALDCHLDSLEPGIQQNLEGEARAAIDLVTSRVERAQFGLPPQPQTILLEGRWRNGPSFRLRHMPVLA